MGELHNEKGTKAEGKEKNRERKDSVCDVS